MWSNTICNNILVYTFKGDFFCLFDCLEFYFPFENFSLIWRHHHASEGLQILTYTQHSWSWLISSDGSLACHTYCDTGHPLIMVISKDPWHSYQLPMFGSGTVTTCFKDWLSNTKSFACEANALTDCTIAAAIDGKHIIRI